MDHGSRCKTKTIKLEEDINRNPDILGLGNNFRDTHTTTQQSQASLTNLEHANSQCGGSPQMPPCTPCLENCNSGVI